MSGKRFLYPDDFESCDHCRGRGSTSCSSCLGRGYREVRRHRSGSYYDETERESCTMCSGSGQRTCAYCGGTGDQRKYRTTTDSAGSERPDGPDDADTHGADTAADELPLSRDDHGALYAAKLAEAERARAEIIRWLPNADALASDYRANLAHWLAGLRLEHPDVEEWVGGAARQLDAPGLPTQARSLRYMLGGLAGACGMAQMHRMMSE